MTTHADTDAPAAEATRTKGRIRPFQVSGGSEQIAAGPFDFVTGVNYFYEDAESATVTVNRRGTSTFTPAGGLPNGNADAGLFRSGDTHTEQKSNSFGWFNSATWHATQKFNVTVGARLAHDAKDYEQTRFPSNGDNWAPAPGTSSTTVTSDHSWTDVDWRGTLDYHFTENLMTYATVSKAYRAGQYSYTIAALIPGPAQSGDVIQPIPPEKVVNYEIGARTTLSIVRAHSSMSWVPGTPRVISNGCTVRDSSIRRARSR